ncbi:hypothetical protein NJI34_07335 [Pseudomonas sp. S 311-6]|uniref:Uncharacterized protein n=1 Tax=Kerstersia gyiorum TaxID=206506 RepID=A0A171KUL4_9BURK|nr:DUF6616 family protein [Kerstersia gyiorum]KKO72581.1 hypothetical protein AAV32_05995 [Kerstersia gyiorum]MCO7636599.1 hypothetical protein [Pseudomonas sp. S 311-6]MCR4159872.1 hypothetical protein [Kerstersia gyiorum]
MPHYLVELYTPNATWQALPESQRTTFLAGIRTAMSGLAQMGIEVLALGDTDYSVDQASAHRFLGIWRFPTPQARDILLAGIKASGWYDYFDHVNAASNTGGLESHLATLARQ